jgi:hypothetical protein
MLSLLLDAIVAGLLVQFVEAVGQPAGASPDRRRPHLAVHDDQEPGQGPRRNNLKPRGD